MQIDRILCNALSDPPPPTSPAIRSSEFESVVPQARLDIPIELEIKIFGFQQMKVPFIDIEDLRYPRNVLSVFNSEYSIRILYIKRPIRSQLY